MSRSSRRLRPARMPVGACVESCTSSPPSSSNRATTPRPSSGVAALRSISQPPLEDVRRGGEAGVDVAVLLGDLRDDVVGPVAVHERRVRRVGVLDVGDDRERLVLDDDRARRVLGDVAVARDDDRDRLADEADLVARQRVLRAPVRDRLVRDDQRQRLRELPLEVVVRVDRVDAFDVERTGHVDVDDPRVGVVGAHERRVRGIGLEVVRVLPLADEQPLVLPPLHSLAEQSRRHARTLAERSVTTGSQPE